MKQPLPPSVRAALSQVADIADKLAETFCVSSLNSAELTACLDNLDDVASADCLADLADAPAKLNAAARAFRQTFPSDSLGWDDAGTLQTIAALIAAALEIETAERLAREAAARAAALADEASDAKAISEQLADDAAALRRRA